MTIITQFILAFFAAATTGLTSQEYAQSPELLDVKAATSGADAPTLEVMNEVIRVAVLQDDPKADIRPSEQGDAIQIKASPASIQKARALIKELAAAPPSERIQGSMLYVQRRPTRNGTGRYYFDREIAQVMGHLGASWLERPSREKEERTSLLIELLGVETETDVADIGAGTGYFTFPIAQKAEEGTIYAVDIQPEMLEFIEARKRHEGIENVEGVLGTIENTQLKPDSIDLAFAVDAYHEFSHPWEMLQSIKRALRPGGQLILVEFRLEDPDVPIKLVHKMSEKQARKEVEAAGFEWVRTDDDLPRQHVLVFQKPFSTTLPTEEKNAIDGTKNSR